MFRKQCTVRQYHSDLPDQSPLEIRVKPRPHQQHVEATFDMLLRHVEPQQLTCRSNRQLVAFDVRHVERMKKSFDMLLRHVEFDMLLRHVAGVDGALGFGLNSGVALF